MTIETGKRVFVLALLLLVALASSSSVLDEPATEYVDAGMKRALTTFAIARALNAAISLAQGTEVTVGIGAALTLSVGEALDPVNDLVESFSDLMLMASVAFGIQKILIVIGQYEYVQWLVIGALAVWGTVYLLARKTPRWLDQILVLMLLVRFAVPVVGVGSEAIHDRFLSGEYQQSATGLSAASASVETIITELRQEQQAAPQPEGNPATKPRSATPEKSDDSSWWPWAGDTAGGAFDGIGKAFRKLDPRPYLEDLKRQASEATDHMINLIVVFVLQTVLVPIFLLWAMYLGLRSVIGKQTPS